MAKFFSKSMAVNEVVKTQALFVHSVGSAILVPVWALMVEQIMTVRDVASYLKLKKRTVYRMAILAKIPAFKVGTSWRFKREDIEEWIEELKNNQQ